MVKRLEADLTQAEVAAKMKVSDKTLRAWEYDEMIPTQSEWQRLTSILPLANLPPEFKTQHWSGV
jgi:ribosome-binding protein aMBF1 (putative translation factor)